MRLFACILLLLLQSAIVHLRIYVMVNNYIVVLLTHNRLSYYIVLIFILFSPNANRLCVHRLDVPRASASRLSLFVAFRLRLFCVHVLRVFDSIDVVFGRRSICLLVVVVVVFFFRIPN